MNIDELLNRYAAGERDFGAINLPQANLTGLDLSRRDVPAERLYKDMQLAEKGGINN